MLRYYITDRNALGGETALLRNIERLGDTIDFLQVREKDLAGRRLASLVRRILQAAHPSLRVLVNDRADVALAAGAHGVHLRANAPSPEYFLSLSPGFIVSVACHSVADVVRASAARADMALLAPVFPAPRKGPALGLDVLAESAQLSSIPVLALGGVTADRVPLCAAAGAAGFAAIRLFQQGVF